MTAPAFELIPAAGDSPILLLCDHAARRLPPATAAWASSRNCSRPHIAYDIGAAAVTRALAESYGAAAVLGGWSRLLIDLNRGEDDPTLVMNCRTAASSRQPDSGRGRGDPAHRGVSCALS